MMQKLLGSPCIIVYFLCLWIQTSGYCPKQCDCNDQTLVVSCDSANLDIVPITLNPELRTLNLSNNFISSIGSSFRFYTYLEYLDISSNNLVALDKDSFVFPHLIHLRLSSNNISVLENDTFKSLHSLTSLYLYDNSLQTLSSEMFKHLQSLEMLELSQNKISFIDERAFFGLTNLKTLLLRRNQLSAIPSLSFQYISKIQKLDLCLNSFKSIPENSFSVLNELKELLLDSCGIQLISHGAFKWLNSLTILSISNNEISEIPTKVFLDVLSLEELHIGQNKFTDIKPRSLLRLKHLHILVINDCPHLERIENGAFTDNVNLRTIIISHNKALRHIEEGAFENLPNIKHVSLQANAFQTFHPTLLPWDKLNSFDVGHNPLVCNCSLLWLWKLLVAKNDSSTDSMQVVCANPPQLKDAILSSLPEVDLDCYALDTSRQIIIWIVLAGAVASATIVMVTFTYRDKVAGILKTKWGRGRKEAHYQKTCAEEENTILQTAHQSLKMTPVTEL